MYDKNNIFAKIISKEIPANIVYENEFILAFNDINPDAEIHILVIPKDPFVSYQDFIINSTDALKLAYFKSITDIAKKLNITDNYKLISNNGISAGQEVPHFHFHIISGKKIPKVIKLLI